MADKKPTTRGVDDRIRKDEKLIDRASAELLASLRRAVGNYSFRAFKVLEDAIKDPGKKGALADVLSVAEQLSDALIDAGMGDVVEMFGPRFKRLEKAAAASFGEFGLPTSRAGLDVDTLNALGELQTTRFLNLADKKLVQPLAEVTIQGVVGRAERSDLIETLKAVAEDRGITTRAGTEFTDRQIETLVNDTFRRQYREAKRQKAEALDMPIVWFQGPLDDATSPQCRLMLTQGRHGLPNWWLADEFTVDLHPKLKEDPKTGGGHPDCRHTVTFVPEEFAISQGFVMPGQSSEEAP